LIQAQIRAQIEASIAVKQALLADSALLGQVQQLAENCLASLKAGGKIIFAGNGGSFADAQHLSAEFTSRFLFDRAPLASIVLAANNSAISAIGNDYGYEFVFARELEALVRPEDVFIAISTSGNSGNILEAVKIARARGVITVGWTGASGGRLADLCDCVRVPSQETARIQESHILVGHILCGLVEAWYFQKET
jgi:D-sedoheptulose 7-phosphate isomerase